MGTTVGTASSASTPEGAAASEPEERVPFNPKEHAQAVERVLARLDRETDRQAVCLGQVRENDLNSYTIFKDVPMEGRAEMVRAAARSVALDRAMGSVCGMGVGDALGHPFEFQAAQNKVRSGSKHFDLERMKFIGESNQFRLKRGQWTDDASMGLCMADSFILQEQFDGSDMRVRFWCWWNRGYNNAFRKERGRNKSVGLGGNISTSLSELKRYVGKSVPPCVGGGGEDAGNGSLMRFAPVAVFMHAQSIPDIYDISRKSSYTTHPGIIAAEACSFLGHLIVSALRLPEGEPSDVKAFLDATADRYLKVSGLEGKSGWGYDQMKWLVTSAPVDAKEACWNWKGETIDVEGTLRARGKRYNGYPVSAGYFGSYALDGLAMALWSVYNTHSFDEAVSRCVNLLGDADSHGSIAGQLAGAIYGYSRIHRQFLKWMNDWDDHEFAIRAILLHHMGDAECGVPI